MKYYSELLKMVYDTPEELESAETKHRAAIEEKKAIQAQEKARKKEVDDAVDKAHELIRLYVRDYGSYCRPAYYMKELLDSIW